MKLFLSTFLFCLISQTTLAQIEEKAGNKHAFGIIYGSTTGNGIGYRYHPSKLGIQFAFQPKFDKENHDIYSGISLLYRVTENEKVNFLLFNGHRVHFSNNYTYSPVDGVTETVDSEYNLGFGVGLELIMFKRLSLNLMTGYGAFDNFERINFSGEFSLLYRI